MNAAKVADIIEAGLLCSQGPCPERKLGSLFGKSDKVSSKEISAAIELLQKRWEKRALELHQSRSGWHFRTQVEHKERLREFLAMTPPRLSRPLTEVLAIIAYHQPATRGDIEKFRGVTTSANQVAYLGELGWIEIVGKRETPGRPLEYGTTRKFLDDLGLRDISELPELEKFFDSVGDLAAQSAPANEGEQEAP